MLFMSVYRSTKYHNISERPKLGRRRKDECERNPTGKLHFCLPSVGRDLMCPSL